MEQPDRERLSPQVRAAVDASMARYRLEQAAAPAPQRKARFASFVVWAFTLMAAVAMVELLMVVAILSARLGEPTQPGSVVVSTPSPTPGPCPSGGVRC